MVGAAILVPIMLLWPDLEDNRWLVISSILSGMVFGHMEFAKHRKTAWFWVSFLILAGILIGLTLIYISPFTIQGSARGYAFAAILIAGALDFAMCKTLASLFDR